MADARIDPLVRSFERSLRAERKSERTIKTYFEALEQLSALLHERGRGLADATTADIQDYLLDIIEHRRPSTANNRFRALHRFYAWLEDEEEIPNPMRRLKPPAVPEDPVPVLDDEALRRLFETCEGRGFDERRDTAILHLFLDGGPAKPTAASRRWIGCKERVLATGPRRRLLIR
jgi:integrase/recombinase XerD